MLNAMPTGYEHLSEDELWDSLSRHELDADGIARTPKLLASFPTFTANPGSSLPPMNSRIPVDFSLNRQNA